MCVDIQEVSTNILERLQCKQNNSWEMVEDETLLKDRDDCVEWQFEMKAMKLGICISIVCIHSMHMSMSVLVCKCFTCVYLSIYTYICIMFESGGGLLSSTVKPGNYCRIQV